MGKVVYHYCSVDTFEKIISNSTLRFRNISHMNDGLEGIWIAKLLSEYCELYTRNWVKNNKTIELIGFIKDDLLDILKEIRDTRESGKYIFCLSGNPDLLSQWRGYGDDAKGISIGIDIDNLIHARHCRMYENRNKKYSGCLKYPDKIFNDDTGEHPAKIVYLETEDIRKQFIKCLFDNIENRINKGIDIQTIKLSIACDVSDMISYKNSYFFEENEYRLECVARATDSESKDPLMYSEIFDEYKVDVIIRGPGYYQCDKKSNNYFEVDFSVIKEAIIKEIYLGPKCKINKNHIVECLKAAGYDNIDKIEIIKSKGSYQ